MKRFFFLLMIAAFSFPALSQTFVNVSGTVTDTMTGQPVANHAVQIWTDSTGGFFYFSTVYTNSTGFYIDTIPLPVGIDSGFLWVQTLDCLNQPQQYGLYFGPGFLTLSQDFQICVNVPPCNADFIAIPDSSDPNSMIFLDQSTGNINAWFWEFGDGNTSFAQNPVHTYASPGFYTVCLTITGPDSLCFDTHCDVINVINPIGCQAQFTHFPDSSGNLNTVHFIDLSSGNPFSWFWDFGDSTYSAEQFPVHQYSGPGTYYVCLTIEAGNGGSICTSTWCEEVTTSDSSDCSSYFTFLNNGLSVSFNGFMVAGQPATYMWNFGDGQTGTGASIIHTYPASGIYYVTLTTTTQNPQPCTYTSGQSITVGDSTQWNQIYGQVFAGNFPLEQGVVMLFSLDTAFTYFPFLDISLVDSSGIYYFPMVPLGSYYIHAIPLIPTGYLPTYYGDVINWEDATLITLGEPNNPYVINLIEAYSYTPGIGMINGIITIGEEKTTLIDKISMILMNASGQPISFQQVDESGHFVFPDLDYGTYYLSAELAGCISDILTIEITVDEPVADISLTFTGNQILGIQRTPVTIEGNMMYPNPAKETASVDIRLDASSVIAIEIYQTSGRMVFREERHLTSGDQTITIAVNQLPQGLYTIRLLNKNGMHLTRKLLVYQ